LYLPLDLSSLTKVRSFAADWATKSFAPIQALLLNAGIQYIEKGVRKTGDGIELTFGSMYFLEQIIPFFVRIREFLRASSASKSTF
jgi:NAD(P)-dependent dehydrogenase (short-subunit alcohol dehydrogenase family)